jgi:hypothetical protein
MNNSLYQTYLLPETIAYIKACSPKPSGKFSIALNELIGQMKIDGNWQLLDLFYITACTNRQNALINVKNPGTFNGTEVLNGGVLGWTAGVGYGSDGTHSYVNTNYNPSTQGINFTQNNCSMGVYIQTTHESTPGVTPQAQIGNASVAPVYSAMFIGNQNLDVCYLNASTATASASINTPGFWSGNRINSGTMSTYFNGATFSINPSPSFAMVNLQFFFLALNNNNTPFAWSNNQTSMGFVGGGGIDQTKFYNSFEKFLFSTYNFQTQTLTWLAHLAVRPPFSYALAMDTLISTLVSDGIFAQLDAFWIFAAPTRQAATVNIVNPSTFSITENNSPSWTASVGYTGNTSSLSYLNTNYSPSINGVNFTQNNNCFGFELSTTIAGNTQAPFLVVSGDATGNANEFQINTISSVYSVVDNWNAISGSSTHAYTTTKGFLSSVRTASTTLSLYLNGTSIASLSQTTTGVPSGNFLFLGLTGGTNPLNFSAQTMTCAFIGSGSINQSNFYNAYVTFANTVKISL